ncbi:biotin--[acetyl-CoA-carboxylase] ligase [Conexibacter sp. JD483]|uniref:biotin--[acetyl-CoA-carboxylase] ligase n=1 Tax=unclassified Conexibacter TaxID=2627773 RepID=UPI00271BC67A|nr:MULTISPECIES: biotin--[acetyl-CoA-carboxylase] ligase [unclassified Conexibacter]MDO8184374.1 biotin--[acetyl-CoA-carboxylase] ligase [Conexibacter sp. CPCC 205706]MDO8197680.1 biotin--[acetyl-CoA-carboxylase] ligase [Conexibacter sp. CPCC 205762]MDR9368343.1 biotin--[acetyl-CoA-carboxylase] ligase [Conexibacter sp. JD483]
MSRADAAGASPATTLGRPRLHHRTIGSTNARAQELAIAGAPHGTIVTAREQSAGRGRQGRAWATPPGTTLAVTTILRDPPPLLTLAAGLAVADVARALDAQGREPRIKWPNDVLLDGRKLAGILAEGRLQDGWAVLGIGINVATRQDDFPPELAARATTLGREPEAVEQALTLLLAALERWLAAPLNELLDAFRAVDALLGREIAWEGGRGTAAGIADDGRLRVRTDDGVEQLLDAGEVHLGALPPAR